MSSNLENPETVAVRRRLISQLADMPSADRKLLMKRLRGRSIEGPKPVGRSGARNVFPVSPGQRQLWILQRLEPESGAYNSSMAVRFKGTLRTDCLEAALLEIEARHEILRTSFPYVEDEPVQVVHPPSRTPLARIDIRSMPAAAAECWSSGFIERESVRPFDLQQLPLVRKALIIVSDTEHVLVVNLHHVLSDEWSTALLIEELAGIYDALQSGAPRWPAVPEIQYADYVIWQLEYQKTAASARQVEYWKRTLHNVANLALPTDYMRPDAPSRRGGVFPLKLHSDLKVRTRQLAERIGATVFMVLLAGFQLFLAVWSGQHDIAVGTPSANRNIRGVERTLGFFVNVIVLRIQIDLRITFAELVNRVRDGAIEAYANEDVPFETVVDAIRPNRSFGSTPLFQVMFQVIDDPAFVWSGASAELIPVPRYTSKFDLTLFIRNTPDAMQAEWNYSADLFAPPTIEDAALRHARLLDAIFAAPDVPMCDIAARFTRI
jgi:hypothetical protein